jgi:magnesium transporter
VRDLYALDEAVLEDARDFFEVPRMERDGGVTYFFARYPFDDKEEYIDTAPLLIVMGESFVLTLYLRDVPQFKPFIENKTAVITTQKAKFFIQIMDVLTRSYERDLTRLRKAVHRNKTRLQTIGSKEITRLVNYEHELNDMIAALIPTNAWLQQMRGGNFMQLYQEDIELMEDLVIANGQLVDSARSVLKTIQNIRQATESILTNNLNLTIRTLTIVTILLTIPTLVSSLYGMNVPLPFSDNPNTFYGIVIIIFSGVLLVLYLFKRNRWL